LAEAGACHASLFGFAGPVPLANFNTWLAQQEKSGKTFTEAQHHWFQMIRDHVAANLSIEKDDFELAPFNREGGLGKVHQLFGSALNEIIEELNGALAA